MVEMIVEVKIEDVQLIFLLVTSYFSLSFDFSPLYFLLVHFFKAFQKTRMMMWRSFGISEESV